MNLSFKQYRAIDLTIMAVILAVSEGLIAVAAGKWFPEIHYVLSPTVTIVCIVMMRWDGFAVIHAVLGGLVYCLASGATVAQYAVYAAGNCGILIALPLLKLIGKERMAADAVLTGLYTVAAYAGTQAGRWLIGLMVGGTAGDIVRFLTTDILSLVFAVIVVNLSRNIDGLFEDQKTYLIRINEEQKELQRMHDHDDFTD